MSHFLEQVYEISDRITVLRNGKLVGEYLVEDLPRDDLVTKMIGRELDELEAISSMRRARRSTASGAPVLKRHRRGPPRRARARRPRGLRRRGRRASPACSARAAPSSSACSTAPTGPTPGQIEVHGEPVRIASPRHAIEHRIAFSSEDRRGEGIVADLTVAENIVLGIQARRGWRRKIRKAEQDAVVAEYIEALGVRPAEPRRRRRQPLGRQPAEGAAGPLAGDCARAAHPRRAHPRHRRRREGRHPAQGRRALGARDSRSSSSPPSSRRCSAWPSASS